MDKLKIKAEITEYICINIPAVPRRKRKKEKIRDTAARKITFNCSSRG